MAKWPVQNKSLYRFRLEPDGSITRDEIKEYGLVAISRNREEYRFTRGGTRCLAVDDVGRVKHNHVTMFEDDIEKARTLFMEHLQHKCADAEKIAADCRALLEKMERSRT